VVILYICIYAYATKEEELSLLTTELLDGGNHNNEIDDKIPVKVNIESSHNCKQSPWSSVTSRITLSTN